MTETAKAMNITFIGGGNMARSLIGGLLANGWQASQISACDPTAATREQLTADFGIQVFENNQVAANTDCLLLAVKPQIMKTVVQSLAGALPKPPPLIISIAAGIRTSTLHKWLGDNIPIVRCMPNTPALIQLGASGLFADSNVDAAQKSLANSILSAVGSTCWVENEIQVDAVTAVSGSGPAYYFRIMEAMESAAKELGLPADVAHSLVLQTARGAAGMAAAGESSPAELRQQVTSPNGTTAAALQQMENDGIDDFFARALNAAYERSITLSNEVDNS